MHDSQFEMTALDRLLATLAPVLEAVGLSSAQIGRGMADLRLGAAQLGLEALEAEGRGHSLTRAVRDPESYPRLVQAHNSVRDILTIELPAGLLAALPRVLSLRGSLPLDELQRDLARVAARRSDASGAFARFFLFEIIRMGVLVSTWSACPHLHRAGVDETVWDNRSEENLHTLLAHPEDLNGSDGARPFNVVLAATLHDILDYLNEATRAYATVSHELDTQYERRAMVEEVLVDAPADDAVLIRNAFSPAWGEQRLDVRRVISQHPLLFEGLSRGVIDQRLSRRVRAMNAEGLGAVPARSRPALVDILVSQTEEM